MAACHCYQMVTVATGEDVMSPEPIANVAMVQYYHRGATVETSQKILIAKVGPITTEMFCCSAHSLTYASMVGLVESESQAQHHLGTCKNHKIM
jgi:hypothetical protein